MGARLRAFGGAGGSVRARQTCGACRRCLKGAPGGDTRLLRPRAGRHAPIKNQAPRKTLAREAGAVRTLQKYTSHYCAESPMISRIEAFRYGKLAVVIVNLLAACQRGKFVIY